MVRPPGLIRSRERANTMTTTPSASGLPNSVNSWSRILGISLRPWSGHSPASLLIRGVIQIAISGFFLWLAFRFATDGDLSQYTAEIASIRLIATLIAVAATGGAVLGLLRIIVGLVDLLTSSEVSGTVVDVRDRRTLDFLPHALLALIYARDPGRIERRRRRTELVLKTDTVVRQWTIRRHQTFQDVRPGTAVRLTVTPLAGHVSRITPLPR